MSYRKFHARLLVSVFLLAPGQLAAVAQGGSYVASIKENPSPGPEGNSGLFAGGGFRADHVSVGELIKTAHRVKPFQITGGPDWLRTAYYDVLAKTVAPVGWPETFAMVRDVLNDRFKLSFHRQDQPRNAFALVRMNSDQLGPTLRRSGVSCGTPPQPAPCGANSLATGVLHMVGWDMSAFADMMAAQTGEQIADDTRLTGTFDLDLRWSTGVRRDGLPTLTTALEQQLGLTLVRRQVTVNMFVIDHLERPTPD